MSVPESIMNAAKFYPDGICCIQITSGTRFKHLVDALLIVIFAQCHAIWAENFVNVMPRMF